MATMDMAKFQIERGWVRVDYYLINNTRPIYQNEHIEISNILKFCVYRAYIERDTSIQKLQNLLLK